MNIYAEKNNFEFENYCISISISFSLYFQLSLSFIYFFSLSDVNVFKSFTLSNGVGEPLVYWRVGRISLDVPLCCKLVDCDGH
jgi:hypothetical protein